MAGSTNLVVPLVMWGKSSPGHCVSCVYLLRDQRTMVTGSHDGQLIIWQLENTDQWNFTPRHMLIGHTGAVRSVQSQSSVLDFEILLLLQVYRQSVSRYRLSSHSDQQRVRGDVDLGHGRRSLSGE